MINNPEQKKDFEDLYEMFYKYVYKYEVGYMEHFKNVANDKWKKEDFEEILNEEGMIIKVNQGY